MNEPTEIGCNELPGYLARLKADGRRADTVSVLKSGKYRVTSIALHPSQAALPYSEPGADTTILPQPGGQSATASARAHGAGGLGQAETPRNESYHWTPLVSR